MSEESEREIYVLSAVSVTTSGRRTTRFEAALEDTHRPRHGRGGETRCGPEVLPEGLLGRIRNIPAKAVIALAIVYNETPKTILDEMFQLVGEDERYREQMGEALERLREGDEDEES